MANKSHIIVRISAIILLLVFRVSAQGGSDTPPPGYQYASFSPSMAVIIVVLIAALFFMGFFSIYIRHCADTSSIAGVRNIGASIRRRTATRGLDKTILETFPTFGYSEIKDKKIGIGALECAVCLNEFEEEDTLRLIPRCDHVFHPECIDAWLESHVTCPVCRANLAEPETVQSVEPEQQQQPGEVSITIGEEDQSEQGTTTTTEPPRIQSRSGSIGSKVWPKFARSHTTGHSVVQPGENVDRFTLRLPQDFRKQVMTRALERTASCVVNSPTVLPTQSSSKRGYRTGFGQSFKKVDPVSKSDRWVFTMAPPFFSRGPSMKREGGADGEGSTSSKSNRGTMKLPSFKCLEPKGDETCLIPEESTKSHV